MSVCSVDVHDSSWFIEVVPINILSCHNQHFQHYRAWTTLLFSVVSFKIPSMYGSINILVSVCPFYILLICTSSDFLQWRMVVMPDVFSCYGTESWHQWSTHGSWVGTEFRFCGCRLYWINNINKYLSWSVCPGMWLCCFYVMIIFVYSMLGGVIYQQICHLMLFRVLMKKHPVSLSWE